VSTAIAVCCVPDDWDGLQVREQVRLLLDNAKKAKEAYTEVEQTMNQLRGSVQEIKKLVAQVKPFKGGAFSAGVWGSTPAQVQARAARADPDAKSASSSLWMHNAIHNTAQTLDQLEHEAKSFATLEHNIEADDRAPRVP